LLLFSKSSCIICDAVDQVKLAIHPQKCQTLVCSSEEASAKAAKQEAEAALLARGSPLAPLRTATRFRYLGHTFAAQGLHPEHEDLARSASLLAHTVRGSSKVARLRPRQIVRLCKTLVLPRLDWGFAVPTDPGESGSLWEEQDRQKAVVLQIFVLMTTKRRKLPDEIILMELGSVAAIWPEGSSRSWQVWGAYTQHATSNGANAQVRQWLHLRAQDRAAYHKKRPHPFTRARQAILAGGGVNAPACDLLRTEGSCPEIPVKLKHLHAGRRHAFRHHNGALHQPGLPAGKGYYLTPPAALYKARRDHTTRGVHDAAASSDQRTDCCRGGLFPYCTQLWKYGPASSSAGDA